MLADNIDLHITLCPLHKWPRKEVLLSNQVSFWFSYRIWRMSNVLLYFGCQGAQSLTFSLITETPEHLTTVLFFFFFTHNGFFSNSYFINVIWINHLKTFGGTNHENLRVGECSVTSVGREEQDWSIPLEGNTDSLMLASFLFLFCALQYVPCLKFLLAPFKKMVVLLDKSFSSTQTTS